VVERAWLRAFLEGWLKPSAARDQPVRAFAATA
jgi:hypothetical protein